MASPPSPGENQEPESQSSDVAETSADRPSHPYGKSPDLLWGRKFRFLLIVLVALLWLLAQVIHSKQKAQSSSTESLQSPQSTMQEALQSTGHDNDMATATSPFQAIT